MTFFKKVTKLLAEDIHKQRILSVRNKNTQNDSVLFNDSLRKARLLRKNEYLKVTLRILNNPFDIIIVLKKDGFKGLFKVLFAPLIHFVVNHSILSSKIKREVDFKLNSIVSNISLKEIQDVQVLDKVMIKA